MKACLPFQEEHTRHMSELIDHFNKNETLTKAYGHITHNNIDFFESRMNEHFLDDAESRFNSDNDKKLYKDISTLYEQTNRVPFISSFVPPLRGNKLDLSVYNQTKRAIDRWAKSLDKEVNSFRAWIGVPSGIYSKDPNMIRFDREISSILNTERQNKANYADNLVEIADGLKRVISAVNGRGSFDKLKTQMDDIYNQIAERSANNQDFSDLTRSLDEIVESKDTKNVIGTYVMMMETMNKSDIDSFIRSLNKESSSYVTPIGYNRDTMRELLGLVRNSKELLTKMGHVNINALKKMKDVVDGINHKYKGSSTNVESVKSRIDSAINRIQEGINDGKYFPHYAIESQLRLEKVMDSADPFLITRDQDYANKVLSEIGESINDLQSVMMSSSKEKNVLFQKDPIKVLESYSQNAVAFNKKQFIMDSYLKLIRDISPTNTDFKSLDKTFEYLAHKYTATTKGHVDANSVIGKTSSTIAKLQTMSKMGFSLTGAVRNATQHFWYMVETGFSNYNNGRNILNSNKTYSTYRVKDSKTGEFMGETINQIIDSVEKDSGYFFDDINQISKGGLIDMNGVDKRSIKILSDENGNPYISFERDGIAQKFDAITAKMTGKSLMFHRFTENLVRKSVYQNAFAQHFDMLFNSDHFQRMTAELGERQAFEKVKKDSHNMALNWVRMTQFEYSSADRPLLFGGGTTNASIIGNSLFQFFPYASHMFNYNSRIIRDGFNAMKDGDFNSQKFGSMMRLFGFQIFGVGLASIIFNNEFEYMIENDTYSRLKDLYGLMTEEHPSDAAFGNGLASIMAGPVVSDMLFWMEAAGFTSNSDSYIAQLLFGYYKLEEMAESDYERAMMNRISVSLAKVMKSRDGLANGNLMDILRANFLLYPSDRTRKGHEYLMNTLGVPTSKSKRRKQEEQVNSTLLDLPKEQRERMIGVVRSINERNQVDRGIPAGLENLTIR